MYEDDACTKFKSLDCLFSELNEICDEIDNDRLKEIGLVFSEVLKNYHIRQGKTRYWVTNNGDVIREWTVDEYIKWNPHNQKLIPCTINNKVIDVKVHCVEIRRIYATHKGRKTMCFFDWIEYC